MARRLINRRRESRRLLMPCAHKWNTRPASSSSSSLNNFAKQKRGLARIIGLPPGQDFTLVDKAPYEPVTTLGLEQSLERAYAARPDYQALLAETKASELSRRAAAAEHLPALAVAADYGDIGVNPSNSNGTYHVTGTINIPIFQGEIGRAHV